VRRNRLAAAGLIAFSLAGWLDAAAAVVVVFSVAADPWPGGRCAAGAVLWQILPGWSYPARSAVPP
jgi:hypothetical protein